MFSNNGEKGTVCRHCMKVWDRQGKRFAQTYDTTSWENDGYKLVVCENCLSKRACERHALKKRSETLLVPSKESIDEEYRKVRELVRLGREPRRTGDFDSCGIIGR